MCYRFEWWVDFLRPVRINRNGPFFSVAVLICEMVFFLSEVSDSPSMDDGRRGCVPRNISCADAISAWRAGRHMWKIWGGVISKCR